MNFALKTRDLVSKSRNLVSKTRNFVLKRLNSADDGDELMRVGSDGSESHVLMSDVASTRRNPRHSSVCKSAFERLLVAAAHIGAG